MALINHERPHHIDKSQSARISQISASNANYAKEAHYSSLNPKTFSLTYQKARMLHVESGVTIEDVTRLNDRFWDFYLSGSCIVDIAACTIVSIHTNLCMGTIAPHAQHQPHLQQLLEQLETFKLCGNFMLTEVGHGLDARHIETTATLSEDRQSFDLHTPSAAAAKSMPPTTPLGGVSKLAAVFAQLIVDGEMHGVRTFVVNITEGAEMCRGISTKLLPQRPGSRPLDHALTWFTHVRLDRNRLLGEIDHVGNKRDVFLEQIHRVGVGGLALSLLNVPALKAGAYLAYTSSQQRTVIDASSKAEVSILSFPTQYGPTVSAAGHAAVMEAFGRFVITVFRTPGVPQAARQAMACIFKATATYATQRHLSELTDRCGWRGLFGFNKISELQLAMKGNSVAEGDVLVLCIRLASELLQGKYSLPASKNPASILARHEQGLFKQLQQFLAQNIDGAPSHRSNLFAQHVTPPPRDLVQAIGHRIAYDAALSSGLIHPELFEVWESDCMLEDASWYVEHAGMTTEGMHQKRTLAIERVRPHLQSIVDGFEMEEHFGSTPLVSGDGWSRFMSKLPAFGGGDGDGEGVLRSRL